MARDEGKACWNLSIYNVQVSAADSAGFYLKEDFIMCRHRDGTLLELKWGFKRLEDHCPHVLAFWILAGFFRKSARRAARKKQMGKQSTA